MPATNFRGKWYVLVQRRCWRGNIDVPKGGGMREVPLSPGLLATLKAHRHLRSEFVFCQQSGARRIHRRADVALKRLARRAGQRSISSHMLRHTFASHLIMRGAP